MAKVLPARTWLVTPVNGVIRSFDVSVETPGPVQSLTATLVSQTSIDFSWAAEPNSVTYNVYLDDVQIETDVAETTYRAVNLTADTTYQLEVRGVNILGAEGPDPDDPLIVATLPEEAGLAWPAQDDDGRLHAIPGINLFGSDSYGGSGRNTGGNVITYYVSEPESGGTGSLDATIDTNTYRCDLEFALEHNSAGAAKQIILARSGLQNIPKVINTNTGGNVSIWGQFAPAPGYFLRGAQIRTGSSENWVVGHLAIYVGDDPDHSQGNSSLDGWQLGAGANNLFFYNCEFGWTTDEAFDAFRQSTNIGLVYCAFVEGLDCETCTDPNFGFGPILGAENGTSSTGFSVERCFFAHMVTRNPYFGARYATASNTLIYNPGRVALFNGTTILFSNQREDTNTCEYNWTHSLVVRGPNCGSGLCRGQIIDDWTWPGGSGAHLSGLAQHGWSNPSSQAGFLGSPPANFTIFATGRANALPSGRSSSFTDVLRPFANPLSPTLAEKRAYADLMRVSVGVQPGVRTSSAGRLNLIFNQLDNALNGISQSPQMYNGVFKGSIRVPGGYFTVPTARIENPASPGTHWHAPMPVGAGIHTPYVSGTFSNGLSRVGYTPREVWAIEQHWFRGGK